jgi:hypothetical protein
MPGNTDSASRRICRAIGERRLLEFNYKSRLAKSRGVAAGEG